MSSGKKTLESFYATLQGAVTKFFERECHIRPCFPKWAVLIQMLEVLNDKMGSGKISHVGHCEISEKNMPKLVKN